MRESEMNPFLQGNFAPWRMEGDAEDLEIIGEIPRGLRGTWYRTGPNPAYEPRGRYHWFDGDGMIHAIRLTDGRAHYRNRYVRSDGLEEERRAGRALFPGLFDLTRDEAPRFKATGNTNVVFHAGKLLALVESSLPTELVPCTLSTLGLYDFSGRLTGPMTAHPKTDPETGEMLFFGYAPFPPYLQYHAVDAEGRLIRSEAIDVAWPSMMHDFAITKDHVIFFLCPLVFDFEKLGRTGTVFHWEPERGTRIGVMPRNGANPDVRWFDVDACFLFHPMNAYENGREIVIDVARYEELRFMSPTASRDPDARNTGGAHLHRWRIDLDAGTVRSASLDDRSIEFPRIDERRVGRAYRFGYAAATGSDSAHGTLPVFTAIEKYDHERGNGQRRSFGEGNGASEPLFVPRTADAGEDEGYVIVLVYDRERNASDFLILDAQNVSAEPLARISLPHRIPYGFHGNWVPAE